MLQAEVDAIVNSPNERGQGREWADSATICPLKGEGDAPVTG